MRPFFSKYWRLTEHLPLKQGLRLQIALSQPIQTPTLTEHLPLKQGLRLYLQRIESSFTQITHRASSTKTRIKTYIIVRQLSLLRLRFLTEHLPLKQGLRHIVKCYYIVLSLISSQSIFH